MQVIVIAISIYFLYRFIFGFLLPVLQTAGRMKKQFGSMKETMNPGFNQQQERPENSPSTLNKTTSGKPGAKEDYIEFEDVR